MNYTCNCKIECFNSKSVFHAASKSTSSSMKEIKMTKNELDKNGGDNCKMCSVFIRNELHLFGGDDNRRQHYTLSKDGKQLRKIGKIPMDFEGGRCASIPNKHRQDTGKKTISIVSFNAY